MREKVDYDLARILIDNGADLESLNIRRQTPLHSFFNPLVLAVARRHVSSLEEVAADVRGMNLAHYFSWTNSSVPADFQCLPNVTSLLDCPDAEGRMPLHLAAQRGNIAVMQYLLMQGANTAQLPIDGKGNTPMHQAVLSIRAPDAIKLLLSHGFRLDVKNHKGHTPVQHGALWGTVEALTFLSEHEPAAMVIRDERGNSLIELAQQVENTKVEVWLRSQYGEHLLGSEANSTRVYKTSPWQKWTRREVGSILFMFILPVSLVLSGSFLLGGWISA